MAADLTVRQRAVYDYIASSIRTRGYPPSYREIGRQLGITNNAVREHLLALERKGAIERDEFKARGLRITNERIGQ